ncbi:hypothetical protein FKZ61_014075 [Litorilinea aerophila]|uniref:Uncharacterized protein n=1 Tax=Litorilinea aerophila TaxID=1204385 RepID=A0A540VG29_9CHLR|nr:hypothetical protein [Litorilinea aerophila]MCC9077230.1 hypothetical protein [Litorilinea aerophila]OUC07967.1 hypothetical protein RY27_11790 [Litorilinea aerophila]GIV78957.1 MAG: hypothetical protein KatS3mg050_3351 [Litorilinea sp.]
MTDPAGNVELILNTSQAALGAYEVTVSVNPTATVSFELSEDAPLHVKEGDGPEILVPGNLIIRKVYLPLIER